MSTRRGFREGVVSGTFTVTLTVRDDDQGITDLSRSIVIGAFELQADPLNVVRTMLAGGTGAGRIVGNAGDDILIAGTTDFDNQASALALIMKEWTRADAAFAIRVDHLKFSGDWNAGHLLTDSTVHDDHAEDVLTGSEGNDWFLFNRDGDGGVTDTVTDLSTFKALYALDLDWLSN